MAGADFFKLEKVDIDYNGCNYVYALPGGTNQYYFRDKNCDKKKDEGELVYFGNYREIYQVMDGHAIKESQEIKDAAIIQLVEEQASAFVKTLPQGIDLILQELKTARLALFCDNQDWCDKNTTDPNYKTVCQPDSLCKTDPDTFSQHCKNGLLDKSYSWHAYFVWSDKLGGRMPVCHNNKRWTAALCRDIKSASDPMKGKCEGGSLWGNWFGTLETINSILVNGVDVSVYLDRKAQTAPSVDVLATISLFNPLVEEFKNRATAASQSLVK